jgi:hypothetical protein
MIRDVALCINPVLGSGSSIDTKNHQSGGAAVQSGSEGYHENREPNLGPVTSGSTLAPEAGPLRWGFYVMGTYL